MHAQRCSGKSATLWWLCLRGSTSGRRIWQRFPSSAPRLRRGAVHGEKWHSGGFLRMPPSPLVVLRESSVPTGMAQ
uniref:Putative secreted protein n=1 Tax=Ixodes ricinus TaxID=34613 RepID=A0A6B0TVQ8_IXORI